MGECEDEALQLLDTANHVFSGRVFRWARFRHDRCLYCSSTFSNSLRSPTSFAPMFELHERPVATLPFGSRSLRPRLVRSLDRLTQVYGFQFQQSAERACKRGLDVFVSGLGLLAVAPLFAVIAVLIKLTDRGPVLFWQTRVGLHGREFPFPKFRSMVTDAESLKDSLLRENDHGSSITFKMKRDPRVTWIGSILRRFSLDELPQLWCVFVGDMSLVGPRPPVPREVALYTLRERRRLEVVPGLTCIWQVSGRGDIAFPQQVELDVDYIRRRGLLFDLKLLAMTIPAVLTGRGAY
jgi:lipopolysaccharide/colanic/teichoic acid biosynthesis glycosyltransferase